MTICNMEKISKNNAVTLTLARLGNAEVVRTIYYNMCMFQVENEGEVLERANQAENVFIYHTKT